MKQEDLNLENNDLQLDGGTYEILKQRLRKENENLREKLGKLNGDRKGVFGSIDLSLLANERVSTEYNCVPRDMFPVGDHFLFGYNIHMGLKTETKLEDVFSFFQFENGEFHQKTLDLINDKVFKQEFNNLYKYYRDTSFAKFAKIGQHLHMVFRIGDNVQDIKTFKWMIHDHALEYVDSRSDHEFKFPSQHDFEWKRTTRDDYCEGEHPHISIEDVVFVEAVGGDLTIKVEDNTKDGKGIYNEPVKLAEQRLEDSIVEYSLIDHLVVMRIKPYQEDFRYFVYNSKLQEVKRIDTIEESCILLPEGHGLIFSDGYYLQTGEFKQFEQDLEHMLFERCIPSPNGEDFLYVFYNREKGVYFLLNYNLIEQKVENPTLCSGFSIFENGQMCLFKTDKEAKKHHVVQIWQTPFIGPDFQIKGKDDSYLYRLGNKDIVRAMAECHALMVLTSREEAYNDLYVDIIKLSTDIIDTYHWLDREEAYDLSQELHGIKSTAVQAVDEYEKVRQIRKNTQDKFDEVTKKADELIRKLKRENPHVIDDFVSYLTSLRTVRGEVISLKTLRYVNEVAVEEYDKELEDFTKNVSKSCASFLLKEDALNPYKEKVTTIDQEIEKVAKVIDANKQEENIVKVSSELEMLIEIVSNLDIEDATETTRIIDSISEIYASFNQIKASLKRKRKQLLGEEGKAEFNAQIKLIDQGVVNYIDLCDTPDKCDEYLTKLMVQLEELEGKFSEFDEFIDTISQKREELYNAFESKKISLVEARNRRANTLNQAAERIIKSVRSRVSRFDDVNEINGYFASDLMVDKLRGIVKELEELGDTVKSDDIQSKLKSVKEESIRQLKDKSELFAEGENLIQLGNHKFTVNTQGLGLTMVHKDGNMYFHLTGTNYFELIEDNQFIKYSRFWDQTLISENREVYRAEYLAYKVLHSAQEGNLELEIDEKKVNLSFDDLLIMDRKDLLNVIQKFMSMRYAEGYVKGVHDQDALIILNALLQQYQHAGLLKFSSEERALARYYWQVWENKEEKEKLSQQLKGAGVILQVFPDAKEFETIKNQLRVRLTTFVTQSEVSSKVNIESIVAYLFEELIQGDEFVVDGLAVDLVNKFDAELRGRKMQKAFEASVEAVHEEVRYQTIIRWLRAFISEDKSIYASFVNESALLLMLGADLKRNVHRVVLTEQLDGLSGTHNLIEDRKYTLDLHSFQRRLSLFGNVETQAFEEFQKVKVEMTESCAKDMRLNEFKPRVLSSFVRNQLIDKVYLRIIGDNFAKQIGSAGAGKRTDLMGMLLLISPPGYGKTTLMEYVSNRLGLIFMKINGPALGHDITSVDPSEAGNAGAKQELEKLNLAFEMGDNVMIYLDDIQHCNPEFLQKFISLCDGQRKIEGVYKGQPKTYDFRGKKVCVVMAGNPYTESGDKFQIPDMLANRADIYNLGDILGDADHEFKLSYLENCLTSNATMARLAGKSHKDVLSIIKIAETGQREGVEFEANHSAIEINEYVEVLKKLLKARDVILKVNMEYIRSAGIAEEYRTEPPFKLQGSYRDMNKMAEKIIPFMNDEELDTLIFSHYEREAQTLTSGAEANLLRFRELLDVLSAEEKERWNGIKDAFMKKQRFALAGGNQMGQMLEQIELIANSLNAMATGDRDSLNENINKNLN
ncbi:DNA repair ATPase [Aureibacter tunicatorum]|uniref:AAA+ ATPase domain-containing protein n=1 Tax=Aureibacter tunicatorum TaxID=866807 RepID=A0AAE3XN43_9BACT|nr:DNA repair ATPase [Aureibacter tunicatorum]MDR6239003.1 hypothetical protein [Aureibacter tunicatorum]BDD05071.1 ATPase AAA [Aureibacter tunicatorum]